MTPEDAPETRRGTAQGNAAENRPENAPENASEFLTENPWRMLRRFTDARIGIGRVGVSIPTRELLKFQIAHAQARDAVHLPLDVDALAAELEAAGFAAPLALHTKAATRDDYLRSPPSGARLNADSAARLAAAAAGDPPDLALIIADGLSSFAVQNNAAPFLRALRAAAPDAALSRPIIVRQGRVAVGDEIGAALKARAVMMLIGERPGLSSPDSLGLYFTWAPEAGLTDARRNCISNIRPGGLDYPRAARRAAYLFQEAAKLGVSGVALKDRSADDAVEARGGVHSFLVAPQDKGPDQ